MSNEVEIVVSSRDRTGPGLAAARGSVSQFANSTKATLGKAGQETGRAFGDGIVRGLDGRLRDSRGRFAKGGQDLGDAISDGVKRGTDRGKRVVDGFTSGALKSFRGLGPGMSAAITAGLVAVEAAAGATAGAVTFVLGGALTTVGMVSAAQSMKVRREWSETGRVLKAELADAAQPMERSAIKAAAVTRRTFGQLKPYLSSFFENSQPAVDRFVKSIGNGVASLGPALGPLQRGYSAVLDAISGRSTSIFNNLSDAITDLAVTAEMSADDIAAALEGVSSVVSGISSAVSFMAEDFDASSAHWSTFFDEMGKGTWIWDAWNKGQEASEAVHRRWADAAATATSAANELGGSARTAAAGLRDLAAEMEELNGPALDAAEAQIRVEEAIDRAAEAARENGRTLDVNTAKGRANKEALIGIARAAQEHIAAMQAENASTEAITRKYGAYRTQLMRAARQAGATKRQAEELADAWLQTPDEVVTHARADLSDLEAKLATAKAKLKDPALTRPQRTALRAEISDLQAKVRAAKAALASVRDKTVTIRTISVNDIFGPGRAHGGVIGGLGGVKRFQDGGVAGSGSSLAMVGEQGPELVRLPVGSTVVPAGQTRARMSAGGGFGSISMAFRAAGGRDSTAGLASSMRDLTMALRDIIGLREGMSRFTDGVMGQSRALIAYEAAWDAVKKSLKDNGKTLNITTTKGRENREALLALADAAHQVVYAMHDMNKPVSSIVTKMKEQRAEFIKIAKQFGLTTAQAKKIADAYGLNPTKVKQVLTKEKADLAYNKKAEAYNATLTGRAAGGPAGGWTLTGERGPELVRLPFGSQVVPAGQTAAMLAAGGGGGQTKTVLEIRSSGAALDEMLLQLLRKAIRVRGGDVQLVLGRT